MTCILISENHHECGINTGLNPSSWVLASPHLLTFKESCGTDEMATVFHEAILSKGDSLKTAHCSAYVKVLTTQPGLGPSLAEEEKAHYSTIVHMCPVNSF